MTPNSSYPGRDAEHRVSSNAERQQGTKKKKKNSRKKQIPSGSDGTVRRYRLLCIGGTAVTLLVMFVSFTGSGWETASLDVESIVRDAAMKPGIQVSPFRLEGGNDICLEVHLDESLITAAAQLKSGSDDVTNITLPEWMFVPTHKETTMWEICDTIPDEQRAVLEEKEGAYMDEKCQSLISFSDEEIVRHKYLDLLMNVSKSAIACAVTSVICVLVAISLGVFAAVKQQIVFAMISGVCFLASGLYTLFAVVLILLRRSELEQDTRRTPPLISRHRSISAGWGVYVGWLAFLCSVLSGAGWVLFAKHLQKLRVNYMHTSKYDQICSM